MLGGGNRLQNPAVALRTCSKASEARGSFSCIWGLFRGQELYEGDAVSLILFHSLAEEPNILADGGPCAKVLGGSAIARDSRAVFGAGRRHGVQGEAGGTRGPEQERSVPKTGVACASGVLACRAGRSSQCAVQAGNPGSGVQGF